MIGLRNKYLQTGTRLTWYQTQQIVGNKPIFMLGFYVGIGYWMLPKYIAYTVVVALCVVCIQKLIPQETFTWRVALDSGEKYSFHSRKDVLNKFKNLPQQLQHGKVTLWKGDYPVTPTGQSERLFNLIHD